MKNVIMYIGYDFSTRINQDAYLVCKKSIERYSNIDIEPIQKHVLEKRGLYWREKQETESTEFSHTRFLVPYLKGYYGYAIFCDSDFLWRCDPKETLQYLEHGSKLAVVQHKLIPEKLQSTKMDGKRQEYYPRKNWSSLMVFDCAACNELTPMFVNNVSAKTLHEFEWLNDQEISNIPIEYNWLVGYDYPGEAKAAHFTNGVPLFSEYANVDYADEWLALNKSINIHYGQKYV